MFRILILFNLFFFVSNCSSTPGTALLGPIFSGVSSGSIAQASLSYSSSIVLDDIKKSIKEKKDSLLVKSSLIIDNIEKKLENPPILFSLNTEFIEISEIEEPEPLP